MAKVKVKGSKLQQDLGGVFTDVAQLTSISVSGNESETVESDTLDNADAGIPYEPTGRTEGGSVEFELIYDPALQGHQNMTDLLLSPAKENWKVVYAQATEMAFGSAGIGFDVTLAQGDLVRASGSLKLDGIPTWPT